jgi:hypothetical protein
MDSKRDLIHLVGLLLSLKRMVMVNGDKLQLGLERLPLTHQALGLVQQLMNISSSLGMPGLKHGLFIKDEIHVTFQVNKLYSHFTKFVFPNN